MSLRSRRRSNDARSMAFACAAAVAATFVASTARAQDSTCRAHASVEARSHFDRGVELAMQSRWQDAIHEFETARDLCVTPAVHYNLGFAYRAVGRAHDAIASFRTYLNSAGAGADRNRDDTLAMIRSLSASLARITVHVDPASATLSVDGAATPPGASSIDVDPGPHVIAAEQSGYRTAQRRVTVAAGATLELEMHLVSDVSAARLVIETNRPESAVRIDGALVGNGQADEIVTGGLHVIDVTAPHHSSFHREIDIATGGERRIQVTLTDQSTILTSPWLWGGVGVVVVAAVVVGFVVLSGPDAVNTFGGAMTGCVGSRCP